MQALDYLREAGRDPNHLAFLKLKWASKLVDEGLSIDAAAARAEVSPVELQHFIDGANSLLDANPRATPGSLGGQSDDDFVLRLETCIKTLVAGHRAGHYIQIDSGQYRSYLRPRLLKLADPDAASLIRELDRRC